MNWFIEGLLHTANMLWLVFWPMVLGLCISACLQVFVPRRRMQQAFGKPGAKSILLATGFGAASSSCSYAAVATGRTVFRGGGALVPTIAFMVAATNIVIELGILLWQLMGWIFVAAEIVGGLLMIFLIWVLATLTRPAGLEDEARAHLKRQDEQESSHDHDHHHHHSHHENHHHHMDSKGQGKWGRVGQAFFMDVRMLWKEVTIGVFIAGFVSVLIPAEWWQTLFLNHGSKWLQLIENVLVGPLIAVASFVCSDGNVPLASLLWSNGISFGGVIAFIYGDLLIIPLLLLYRKCYGLKTAIFIAMWLYVSMVAAGLLVDLLFQGCGWVPSTRPPAAAAFQRGFSWDSTAWLNIAAVLVVSVLAVFRFQANKAQQRSENGAGSK